MAVPIVGGQVTSWTDKTGSFYANLISRISANSAAMIINSTAHNTTGLILDSGVQTTSILPGLGSAAGSFSGFFGATPIMGSAGLVTMSGGYVLHVDSYRLDIRAAVFPITALGGISGDTTPASMRFRPGFISGTAQINARIDDSTSLANVTKSPTATSALATLTLAQNATWSIGASAMLNQLNLRLTNEGTGTVTYGAALSGNITPAGASHPLGTSALDTPVWDSNTTAGGGQPLVLTAISGKTYTVSAFWTHIGISCAVGQPVLIDVDFQGNGDVTIG